MNKGWLTLEQAASRAGRSVEEIRAAVVMEELTAKPTSDESSYLVSESSLGERFGLSASPAPPRIPRRPAFTWMEASVVVVIVGILVVLLSPFPKRLYDNRAPGWVGIVKLNEQGHLVLADGRTVRLFGLKLSETDRPMVEYLAKGGAHVTEVIPGQVPAVRMVSYSSTRGFCANCQMTWNPVAPAKPAYRSHLLGPMLICRGQAAIDIGDLEDPRSDPAAVAEIVEACAPGSLLPPKTR